MSDTDTDDDVPSPISPASSASPSPTPSAPVPRVVEVRRENDKTATELCSYAVLWWVFLGVLRLANVGGGVSRRMANLQYVVWIAAYNATFILGYLVLDLAFFASPLSRSVYSPTSKLKLHPDPRLLSATRAGTGGGGERRREAGAGAEANGGAQPLLEAINKNGLVLFLLVRAPFPTLWPLFLMRTGSTTGERGDGADQPVDADDVRERLGGNGRADALQLRRVCSCVGMSVQEDLAVLTGRGCAWVVLLAGSALIL